jgi:hypothetical protein
VELALAFLGDAFAEQALGEHTVRLERHPEAMHRVVSRQSSLVVLVGAGRRRLAREPAAMTSSIAAP